MRLPRGQVVQAMASTLPVEPVTNGSASNGEASDDKRITLETLKEHGKRDDLWLLVHGKVYDVTKFMDEVGSLPWRSKTSCPLKMADGNVASRR